MSIARLIDRTIEGILKDAQFAYDYIIYTDGTYVYAFNTKTKQIDFVGTDARVVIQSAINALPNGGTIFIKAGNYNISPQPAPTGSQVPYCGLILSSNIRLKGEGRYATVLTTGPIPSTANNSYFTMLINKDVSTGDSGIIVEDIGFDLPPPIQTTTGMQAWDVAITFYGVHDSIVRRCWINNGSIGVWANTTYLNTSNALTLGNNTRNIIEENIIQNQTGSSTIFQGTKCWFIKNVILGAWDDALLIGSAGQGHRILYNILDNSAVVSGKGGSSGVIFLDNDGAADSTTNGMADILIEGNIIRNNNLGSGPRTGIMFINASRITIKNNIIENNIGMGIWTYGVNANDITIEGNIIRNNGGAGIKAEADAGYTQTDIIIEKNIIYGNNSYAIQLYSNGVLQNVLVKDNFTFNQVNNSSYWIAVEVGKTLTARLISNVILDTTTITLPGPGSPSLLIKFNIGYSTENFKATGLSVPVGVSGAYGSAVSITSLSGIITYPRVKITWGGTFGTGETVTVQITAVYSDGTTASITKSATAVGSLWLTDDDVFALIIQGKDITQLQVSASSNLASTSVTVTVNAYGKG